MTVTVDGCGCQPGKGYRYTNINPRIAKQKQKVRAVVFDLDRHALLAAAVIFLFQIQFPPVQPAESQLAMHTHQRANRQQCVSGGSRH